MTPEELIGELDNIIDDTLREFSHNFPGINGEIYQSLLEFSSSLQRNANGSLKASAQNLKTIQSFKVQMDKILVKSGYSESIATIVSRFSEIRAVSNEYMTSMFHEFSSSNALYKEILKQNVITTTDALLGSGIDANFKQPIIKLLKNMTAGQTDSAALREQLKNSIFGAGDKLGYLERYSGQVAQDSMMQFQRNYMQVITDDLELKHYLYAGTKIGDTREFCARRTGKYWTEEEVINWAHLSWQGKIPETNEFTIKTYLGGYRCRHKLIPVSKALYDKYK